MHIYGALFTAIPATCCLPQVSLCLCLRSQVSITLPVWASLVLYNVWARVPVPVMGVARQGPRRERVG
jgi:hypothetical protein